MPESARPSVCLIEVDDPTLDGLVAVAVEDASADEVTPPITPGVEWTPGRVEWLRRFHRDRRLGLDGVLGEATWAITEDARVVGSIRLKMTSEPGELEAGTWLSRSARGRGIASQAMSQMLSIAKSAGAHTVRATTTTQNVSALALLRTLGFDR